MNILKILTNKEQGAAGFSLIEVLISVAISAIVMIGISLMFGLGKGFLADEGNRRVAISLAQEQVEGLKGKGFSDIETTQLPQSPITEDPVVGNNFGNYCRQTTLSYVLDYNYLTTSSSATDTIIINVAVTPATGSLSNFSPVNLATIITNSE